MKQTKLLTALLVAMTGTLISCDDAKDSTTSINEKKQKTSVIAPVPKAQHSQIVDFIPNDTPLLVLYSKDSNYPLPQNFINKMNKVYSSLGEVFKSYYLEAYKDYSKRANPDYKDDELNEFADKWFNQDGFEKIGFSIEKGEFALYAIDLFPVMRMTLAKNNKMSELLDDLMKKANKDKTSVEKKQLNGKTVYKMGDKEAQLIIGLNGQEFVISIAPTRDADALTPKLLGFNKPQVNVTNSSQYKSILNKYDLMGNSLFWLNIKQVADYFINPAQHDSKMLDILQVQDNLLSADCKSEIFSMIDKMPRIVGGNRKFDEHQLDYTMIFEMPSTLGSQLSTLSGRIPATDGTEALSYGISFDIVAAQKLARQFVTEIETNPYKCEYFHSLNQQTATVKAKLDTPLPPFVSNFKGFNVVVDALKLDFSKDEPSEMVDTLKAKLLLAVNSPESLLGMASMMMPDVQKLGIKKGGKAINISELIPVKGTMMPINLDHVFVAIGDETIGLSLGEGSDLALTQSVAKDSNDTLLTFNVSAELYKNLFEGMQKVAGELTDDKSNQLKMQKLMMTDMIWWEKESGSIDFTNNGLEINLDINY